MLASSPSVPSSFMSARRVRVGMPSRMRGKRRCAERGVNRSQLLSDRPSASNVSTPPHLGSGEEYERGLLLAAPPPDAAHEEGGVGVMSDDVAIGGRSRRSSSLGPTDGRLHDGPLAPRRWRTAIVRSLDWGLPSDPPPARSESDENPSFDHRGFPVPDWHCMEEIRHQSNGRARAFCRTNARRRWIASAWGRWSAYSGDVAPPFRRIPEATRARQRCGCSWPSTTSGKAPGSPFAYRPGRSGRPQRAGTIGLDPRPGRAPPRQ